MTDVASILDVVRWDFPRATIHQPTANSSIQSTTKGHRVRLSVAYKDCYGPFRTTGSHAEEDLSLKVTCCELPFSRHDDGAARFKHCPADALLPPLMLRH